MIRMRRVYRPAGGWSVAVGVPRSVPTAMAGKCLVAYYGQTSLARSPRLIEHSRNAILA